MYLENFKSQHELLEQFEAPAGALDGAEVLLAWYGDGSYCGQAFVLYRKDGKLFEVNGSHCSCYGLEGQWEPEETTVEALKRRDFTSEFDYYDGGENAAKQLPAILEGLSAPAAGGE